MANKRTKSRRFSFGWLLEVRVFSAFFRFYLMLVTAPIIVNGFVFLGASAGVVVVRVFLY